MIAAVSIEGLVGTAAAFDIDIHNARPHKGQIKAGSHGRSSQPSISLFPWTVRGTLSEGCKENSILAW